MKLISITHNVEFDYYKRTTIKVLGYTLASIERSNTPDTSIDLNLGPVKINLYICKPHLEYGVSASIRGGVRLIGPEGFIRFIPVPFIRIDLDLLFGTLGVSLF